MKPNKDPMKLDIVDLDKLVKVNNLLPISNPITFEKDNTPSEDGVLSIKVFGRGQKERRLTFAYVDLKEPFLHPKIYLTYRKLNRNIDAIITGLRKFIIKEDGSLEEDEENGNTGMKWLYKNYDKIKFKKNTSNIRNERVELIEKLPRNEAFVTKWILIPAYFRDMQSSKDSLGYDVLNEKYNKLIRLTSSLDDDFGLSFIGDATRMKVQETLVDIYKYFEDTLKGKNGYLRSSLMSVNVDYGSRLVISAPQFNVNRPEDLTVDFDTCSIPLHIVASMFLPFVVHWLKSFFERNFGHREKYSILNKKGEIEQAELINPMSYFTEEYIKKNIDRFVASGNTRYDRIQLPVKADRDIFFKISGRHYDDNDPGKESDIFKRYATWTDLIYMACVDVVKDKFVWITRYPVSDHFSVFPNKIHVASTFKTTPVRINQQIYPHYPVINIDTKNPENDFINTLQISNVFLLGLGGD